MKTKIIPFDLETAKKIQAGKIEGRIVTNEGNEVEIVRFNLIQNSFPILAIIRIPNVVSDYWEDVKLFQLNGKHENVKLWLEIELPEESIKLSNDASIEQLEKLKNYTQQIMNVNQHVIDNLNSMVRELKEICKLPEQKHEFKPFDKVLVRDRDEQWRCDYFSHISNLPMHKYAATSGDYEQCIPYEGNEPLVGTTDKPKEE